MNTFEIPIFKKTYELYKSLSLLRRKIPKQDRYTLWQKCENLSLDIINDILLAGQLSKEKKIPVLEKISLNINCLRVFLRLGREVGTIDNKKYSSLSLELDEVGKMLGGWLKSSRK